ncbi:MAG: hypothetical protein HY566_03755 [Candidatus Kerfeldbacteria bacterium]|nr:hypothetical protein [Candidatus Kerfeldbacteria bacterium]
MQLASTRLQSQLSSRRSMFGVLVLALLLAWSLVMGYFLLHLSDHSMDTGCPLMVGQGLCMNGQTPLTVVQQHLNFVRQLTQATLQSSILALALLIASLLVVYMRLIPLIVQQRFRPPVVVDDTPREQRKRHWLALHEQRDPYRF